MRTKRPEEVGMTMEEHAENLESEVVELQRALFQAGVIAGKQQKALGEKDEALDRVIEFFGEPGHSVRTIVSLKKLAQKARRAGHRK